MGAIIDIILFPTLVGVLLVGVFAALRRWRPPARRGRSVADPALIERMRNEAYELDLRGAIVAISDQPEIAGLVLTRLGPVHLLRDNARDATAALAREAAARYPRAKAMTHLAHHTVNGGVEWRAMVCAAVPLDPALRPALAEGVPFSLVDGSNVINWEKNAGTATEALLSTLIRVLDLLRAEGRGALVVFDATAGYALAGHYMNEVALLRALGQRRDVRVDVVHKGMVADRHLIDLGLQSGVEIITNDLYRDHPDAAFLPLRRGFAAGGHVELLPLRVPVAMASL